MKQYLRYLPPVHELQKSDVYQDYLKMYRLSEERLTRIVQEQIEQLRNDILNNKWTSNEDHANKEYWTKVIFTKVDKAIEKISSYYLKRIINATGTILHTNLGRARLGNRVIEHTVQVAKNYSNLEYNITEGKRGSRHDIIEGLIKEVTGAEAAMVVNNNAAAVYLILRALAKDKEVIVSRGQLVEIGGSFRVSSIMEESGARLVEIGTTNKTHYYDYEQAITEDSAMILKVHTSNFKIVGFTEEVDSKELIQLKNQHEDLIFYEDLGSGALYDFRQHGIGEEPVVKEVIEMGADLVSFSGDKLLGGPQAGIIAGKKVYIDKLKKHQLARVLRVDKMTFAALEATLKAYLLGEDAIKEIPTVRDILQTPAEVKEKAEKFKGLFIQHFGERFVCEVEQEYSQIGGGTMPEVKLPTYVVTLSDHLHSSEQMSTKLRNHSPSIVARQKDEKLLLDFRTISEQEISDLIDAFNNLFSYR